MKILITGGAGFIGSHVAEACLAAGHDVTVLDNLSTGKRENIPKGVRFVEADLTGSGWESIFTERGGFDVVDHHAAQIDVRKSVKDPVEDARINILGTLNLLENCRKQGVQKIVFASSGGTIYGECHEPADESKPANPLSPYGIAKLTVEYYLKFYAALYGLPHTVLRYGNVYGPRQDPLGEAGVAAIFCGAILRNSSVTVFGDGRQTRDYVYVKDVAQANLLALTKGANETLNVGTQRKVSVNELFEILKAASGYKGSSNRSPARPGELMDSVLNCEKAKRVLGWSPETRIEEGLRATLEWTRGSLS